MMTGTRKHLAPQPYVRMGFLVHDVSRMRRTLFDQACKDLAITRAQWWALANLSREKEGVFQSDLARVLDVGKVTLGGLVDRLEAKGFVQRRSDLADRRLKRVFITPVGFEIIKKMKKIGERLNIVVMDGITSDHASIAEDVLQHMKNNLRNLLSGSPGDRPKKEK